LKDISLTVNKGECIGVVGRNGAGKSTFLSLLLGTILPTRGSIVMDGKKTPLLELGAGFHPDLTGVENIIINGVLLGLTKKEVLERMQDIIDFSELGDFINMPTRTYSSGMYMRLAFSVAIHTEPEILLIDEILAVGDASFHIKSYNALMNLIKGGVTTVYVSHDLDSVQTICDRVIWLDKGRIKREGDPASVIQEYTNEVSI
jgi:ABC-type polysaccharide/polyol phosphate transport system ATPase subunit